jgi:hypothetical protein
MFAAGVLETLNLISELSFSSFLKMGHRKTTIQLQRLHPLKKFVSRRKQHNLVLAKGK